MPLVLYHLSLSVVSFYTYLSSLTVSVFNKCICNLASEYNFNCGFKFFFDLSDVVYTQVVYITYNMGNPDLPDIFQSSIAVSSYFISQHYKAIILNTLPLLQHAHFLKL